MKIPVNTVDNSNRVTATKRRSRRGGGTGWPDRIETGGAGLAPTVSDGAQRPHPTTAGAELPCAIGVAGPMNFAKLTVNTVHHCILPRCAHRTDPGDLIGWLAPAPRGGKQKPPRDVVVVLVRDGKQPGVGQGSSRVALNLVRPARR